MTEKKADPVEQIVTRIFHGDEPKCQCCGDRKPTVRWRPAYQMMMCPTCPNPNRPESCNRNHQRGLTMHDPLTLEQIELGERLCRAIGKASSAIRFRANEPDAPVSDAAKAELLSISSDLTDLESNIPTILAAARRELEREDATPIDAEFLKSLGFVEHQAIQWRLPILGSPTKASEWFVVVHDGCWIVELAAERKAGKNRYTSSWLTICKASATRGQLLALLHGLGIGEETR